MAREWVRESQLEGDRGAGTSPMEEDLIEVFGCVSLHDERRLIMLDPRGRRNGMNAYSEDALGAKAARH